MPNGQKTGQQLLNEFVEQLALDLPRFMEASGTEKAKVLLQIIGVGPQLAELEKEEKELYQERLYVGRTADQKEKFAKEQPYYPEAPRDLVSPSELIRQQQEILAKNGENQRKRDQAAQLRESVKRAHEEVIRLSELLEAAKQKHLQLVKDLDIAETSAKDLTDQSTEELEANISNIEEINRKVRANLDKEKAEDDAKEYRTKYDNLTKQLEETRDKKNELLTSAELPLPELRSLYCQMVGRGTRLSPETGKDHLLLLDFLWHTERHELCHPASLICENEEVAQKMTENLEREAGIAIDIEEAEKTASEDVVAQREESLAKQLAEMKKRKKKLVDPLQFEMSIQAEDLSSYVPSFGWEMGPPSDKQKQTLEKLGIMPDQIENAGKAAKILDRLDKRRNEGLTTPKQIRFLEGRGFKHVGTWQFNTAKNLIDRIAGNGWKIPNDIVPQEYKGA